MFLDKHDQRGENGKFLLDKLFKGYESHSGYRIAEAIQMSKLNAAQYDALFFSPHLDDAVLSCGGLLARLKTQKKKTLVVTLFTQGQELALKSGDLQNFLKQSSVKSTEELFRKRRREDVRVAKFLGFDIQHLNFTDALWRTHQNIPLYPTFKEIFAGEISSHDKELMKKVKENCSEIIENSKKSVQVYAPLAIGRHVDHVLIFKLLQDISRQLKRKLLFWTDVPYRDQVGATEKRLAILKFVPRNFLTSYSAIEAAKKEKACDLYATQLPWLKKAGLGTLDYYKEGFFEA